MLGFAKFYRELQNTWIYADEKAWKVYSHILFNVTFSSIKTRVKGHMITLYPGQIIFGRDDWERRLNIDGSRIYRIIQLLEDSNYIKIFTIKGQYSIITLCGKSLSEDENSEQQTTLFSEQENEQEKTLENKGVSAISEQENEQHSNSTCTHNKNGKKEKKKDIVFTSFELEVLEHWNHAEIIKHSQTEDMQKAIKNALNRFSKESILHAIDNYTKVYQASKTGYWYSHQWRLDKFLKQSNGVPDFLDDGQQYINFLNWKTPKNSGGNSTQPKQNQSVNVTNKTVVQAEDWFKKIYERGSANG